MCFPLWVVRSIVSCLAGAVFGAGKGAGSTVLTVCPAGAVTQPYLGAPPRVQYTTLGRIGEGTYGELWPCYNSLPEADVGASSEAYSSFFPPVMVPGEAPHCWPAATISFRHPPAGVVFKARDKVTQRVLALKQIR